MIAATASLGTASSSAAAAAPFEPVPAGFCAARVVHDYLKPLTRLPKLTAPPASGFDFGPWNLWFSTSKPLLVGGGTVGYSLRLDPNNSANVAHPKWRVVAELSRVNRIGDEVESIKVSRRAINVSRRHGRGLHFELGKRPGLYRFLVDIQGQRRKPLGSFGYYVRVVPPVANAQLTLNAPNFSPGQTVLGHVENFGTATASFGAGLTIERLEGSSWTIAPESPRGPVPAIAYLVGPGMSANGCSSFAIPPTMPLGHYRMSLSPELATEFDVVVY